MKWDGEKACKRFLFRLVILVVFEAESEWKINTQYQQATPLDSQTEVPSASSCGSLSGRFPETLVKKYSEKVKEE